MQVSETDSAAPQQGSRTGSKPASRIASKAGSRATSKASSKASSKVGSRINSKPGSAQPSENNSVAGDVASQHSQKKDQSGNTTSRGEEESAPNSPVIAGQKSVTIVEPEKEIPPARCVCMYAVLCNCCVVLCAWCSTQLAQALALHQHATARPRVSCAWF